ncbi:hypothetical protein DLREEDagrD3_25940 [Denitratisoma sp. agr-D3]
MAKAHGGFTTIELVVVLVLLGILAFSFMTRWNNIELQAATFHDKTVAALRHGQKTATSHRRVVCVGFSAATVTLTMALASGSTASCSTALLLPGDSTNVVTSPNSGSVYFSPVPAGFSFLPDGSAADRTLAIGGQPAITVVGKSGYVQ